MNKTVLSIVSFSLLFIFHFSVATAQVVVSVNPPAGFVNSGRDLWNINIVNSGQAKDVFVELILSKNGKDVIKQTCSPFSLKKGISGVTGYSVSITEFKVTDRNIAYSGTNVLIPNGEYSLCAKVIEAGSFFQLAENCAEYSASQLSPPFLVYPPDQSVQSMLNPILTWSPPSPLPAGVLVKYKLKLTDIFSGQSAEDAINRNTPLFYADDILPTSLVYPFTAIQLQKGKKYAWRVYAVAANDVNIGNTEVWSFSIDANKVFQQPDSGAYAVLRKEPLPGYFLCLNGILRFKFTEEYVGGPTDKLKVKITTTNGRDIFAECKLSLNKSKGDNYYTINFNPDCLLADNKLYLLEVTNEKKEKFQLNFKMKYE